MKSALLTRYSIKRDREISCSFDGSTIKPITLSPPPIKRPQFEDIEPLKDDVIITILSAARRDRHKGLKRILDTQLVNRHIRTMGARIGVTKRLTIHKNSKKVALNGIGLRGSDLTRRLYFLLSRCRRISSLELCPFNGRNAKIPSPIFRHHDLNGTIESLIESNTTCRHLHFNRSFLPHIPEFGAQFRQFLAKSLVRHLHITFDVKADVWTFLQVLHDPLFLSQDALAFESIGHLTIDAPFQWPAWDRYIVPASLLPPYAKSNIGDIFKFFPRLAVFNLTLAVAKGSDDLRTVARQIEYFEDRMNADSRGTLTLYDVTLGDLPSFPYELPDDMNYPPEVERLRTAPHWQMIEHDAEKIALKTENGRLTVNLFLNGHRRNENVFM
uniref:Uncharacterized protein n=1 Tax=Plectus sambesii TaxID=2011161 RepID=A0A914VP68_9BILA